MFEVGMFAVGMFEGDMFEVGMFEEERKRRRKEGRTLAASVKTRKNQRRLILS